MCLMTSRTIKESVDYGSELCEATHNIVRESIHCVLVGNLRYAQRSRYVRSVRCRARPFEDDATVIDSDEPVGDMGN